MQRRKFLKKTALATAGLLASPYILPSGRLFAKTASRRVNHVVLCLYAGGVRNTESVHQAEGNLMPNTLRGNGNISSDIAGGMTPLPPLRNTPLQNLGTLFKEFRYAQGPTGHFNGHTTAITGTYTNQNLDLRTNPTSPTLFELYRKHNSPSATALNAWWVSDTLGPYPALNYSTHPDYGAAYGANYVQPFSMLNPNAQAAIGAPKNFHAEELQKVKELRNFLNNNFSAPSEIVRNGVKNSEEERLQLEDFFNETWTSINQGGYDPWGIGAAMNNDGITIHMAERIIRQFQPELLVVNMQGIDVGHTNFTAYCNNMRKADYAAAKLWETIQNTPGMADDTVMIMVPEHGRNREPNTLRDDFGRFALDHTSDESSRELFCLLLGPAGVIKQNQTISEVRGESIDVVPTIAHLLGFDADIPAGILPGRVLEEALV